MKIKENVILAEHRELHWLYWYRRHCQKYLELWKERRFRYTCIGIFCQRYFFKFKVQFIGVFRTQPNIYDGAFCENSSRLLAVNYFRKGAPSQMFDWVLNTPPQFGVFCHHSSLYATILGSCSNFGVRMYFVSLCYNIWWGMP